MKKMIPAIFIGFAIITACSCASQKKGNSKVPDIKFEKIVYHSSRCFGFCPQIDLEVDNKRNITLRREFNKRNVDETRDKPGKFKGVLSQEKYDSLLIVLKASNYNNLVFPDVTCCDGVITTIIIYSNGVRKYYKSMTPPDEALNLIAYLRRLGLETDVPKIEDEVNFED